MFKQLLDLQSAGISSVLVTIVGAKGSTPREVGTKMLITADRFFGTIGGGNLEWIVTQRAREILRTKAPSEKMVIPLSSKAQQCCGGSVEIFLEHVTPCPQLVIFGAGHVTQALLEVLAGTNCECLVVDRREEWITAAQQKAQILPDLKLTAVIQDPLAWIAAKTNWSAEITYVIVMTHDHALDEKITEIALTKPAAYVGLIGSKTKRQRFEQRFLQNEMDPKILAKLRCPIGLPIGDDKSPKSVAISIAAELVKFWDEKSKK